MEKFNNLRFWLCVILMLAGIGMSICADNKIKIGTAKVVVRLPVDDDVSTSCENMIATVYAMPLLGDDWMQNSYSLKYDGKALTGDIPVYLQHSFIGIQVCSGDSTLVAGALTVDCDTTNVIELVRDAAGRFVSHVPTSRFAIDKGADILAAIMRFEMAKEVAPKEFYEDRNAYVKYETEELFPSRLNDALAGFDLPEEISRKVRNALKLRYYAGRVMTYAYDGNRFYGLAVEEPPVEFYGFINDIDFSSEILDIGSYGLRNMLSRILATESIGIGPIGDSPIPDWQHMVCEKLRPVITQPTQLFLDLLAAMSYIQQIEYGNRLLSPQQIKHINSHFTDDLGKIVLSYDKDVRTSLKPETVKSDLSDGHDAFNLDEILAGYRNRTVVVDVWNTWCAPCLAAHKKLEPLKADMKDDVTFIYIADVSSDKDKWSTYAERIGGVHILLDENNADAFYSKYGITAVPTYLFFNRNHELMHMETGFPGEEKFSQYIFDCNSIK